MDLCCLCLHIDIEGEGGLLLRRTGRGHRNGHLGRILHPIGAKAEPATRILETEVVGRHTQGDTARLLERQAELRNGDILQVEAIHVVGFR